MFEYIYDDTGLYYYNARYYDPETKRFITADTIVRDPYNPQSLNRYSYCENNPIIYTDPSGHNRITDIAINIVGNAVGITAIILTGGTAGGFVWAEDGRVTFAGWAGGYGGGGSFSYEGNDDSWSLSLTTQYRSSSNSKQTVVNETFQNILREDQNKEIDEKYNTFVNEGKPWWKKYDLEKFKYWWNETLNKNKALFDKYKELANLKLYEYWKVESVWTSGLGSQEYQYQLRLGNAHLESQVKRDNGDNIIYNRDTVHFDYFNSNNWVNWLGHAMETTLWRGFGFGYMEVKK